MCAAGVRWSSMQGIAAHDPLRPSLPLLTHCSGKEDPSRESLLSRVMTRLVVCTCAATCGLAPKTQRWTPLPLLELTVGRCTSTPCHCCTRAATWHKADPLCTGARGHQDSPPPDSGTNGHNFDFSQSNSACPSTTTSCRTSARTGTSPPSRQSRVTTSRGSWSALTRCPSQPASGTARPTSPPRACNWSAQPGHRLLYSTPPKPCWPDTIWGTETEEFLGQLHDAVYSYLQPAFSQMGADIIDFLNITTNPGRPTAPTSAGTTSIPCRSTPSASTPGSIACVRPFSYPSRSTESSAWLALSSTHPWRRHRNGPERCRRERWQWRLEMTLNGPRSRLISAWRSPQPTPHPRTHALPADG